jgi:hypothetical protein
MAVSENLKKKEVSVSPLFSITSMVSAVVNTHTTHAFVIYFYAICLAAIVLMVPTP